MSLFRFLPRYTVSASASALLGAACLPGGPSEVSPPEIPDIEARLENQPNNGKLLLRYGAALFAAGRCDSAATVARRGADLRPADALGPLVIGQCLEQASEYDEAIALYASFANAHGDSRGAAAVRARDALAREQALTAQPANINVIAVLPLTIAGDTTYAPLGRGLAQMLTSDLSLLQRFTLVERLQIGALLQELQLSQTGRVDPATAARVGRLVRAGRMVQGTANMPAQGDVRLEATVVLGDGQVTGPEFTTGRLRDLLRMEKELVVGISLRLGYQLSQAERQLILENGTDNLTAFSLLLPRVAGCRHRRLLDRGVAFLQRRTGGSRLRYGADAIRGRRGCPRCRGRIREPSDDGFPDDRHRAARSGRSGLGRGGKRGGGHRGDTG